MLTFVKREGSRYPGNVGHHAGTTSQEVLRALIDRAKYVNAQLPCAESEAVIGLLQSAMLLLEVRAARLKGAVIDQSTLADLLEGPVDEETGHILARVL